jgi:hypothetical protein
MSGAGGGPDAPAVTVLIIHLGRTALLETCLATLHATSADVDLDVVVVDNQSDAPAEVAALAASHPRTRVLRLAERVGYGAATNAGLRASRGGYVLWCNNDLVFRDGAVRRLADFLDASPAYAVATPKLLNPDGTFQPCFSLRHLGVGPLVAERLGLLPLVPSLDLDRHWRGYESESRDVAVAAGACCLIRRAALDAVGGGLDPAFFMYAEEFDLCHRLWNAGWRVRYLPSAEVVHLGGQSSHRAPSASKFPFVIQGWRSKFRYLRKHQGRAAELTFAAAFVAGGAARALATGVLAGVRRLAGQQEASSRLWARSRLNAHLVAMAARPERRAADKLPTYR